MEETMTKLCPKCRLIKSIEEFSKNKTEKNGRGSWCKECMKKHYIKNQEKFLRQKREYYANHREKLLKRAKEYRSQHPDKVKGYDRKRYVKKVRAKGKESWAWKGGIYPLEKMIRALPEYTEWRISVFERDHYTCNYCIKRGVYLEAHHYKKSFSEIFQEFLKEYDQFSPIEDKETLVRLAMKYEPFWDVNNGETLCKRCHKETRLKERMQWITMPSL